MAKSSASPSAAVPLPPENAARPRSPEAMDCRIAVAGAPRIPKKTMASARASTPTVSAPGRRAGGGDIDPRAGWAEVVIGGGWREGKKERTPFTAPGSSRSATRFGCREASAENGGGGGQQ